MRRNPSLPVGPSPSVPWIERVLLHHKKKLILVSFFLMLGVGLVQNDPKWMISRTEARKTAMVQSALAINLLLFQYRADNDGHYPPAHSSTEIFQALLDGKYVMDPAFFYFPMPGKTKPTSRILKPENVCWDITYQVGNDDPDDLPTLFPTGYKIDYVPGGQAHPLIPHDLPGLAIAYKSNQTRFQPATPAGITVVDAGFDPKGRTYQQLTPDGVLPAK